MDRRTLVCYGFIMVIIQSLISCGIFVTYPQMAAYAVSKDKLESVEDAISALDSHLSTRLTNIENKLDKVAVK